MYLHVCIPLVKERSLEEKDRTQEAEDPTTTTKEEGSTRTTVKANLELTTVPQAQVQTTLIAAGRQEAPGDQPLEKKYLKKKKRLWDIF